MGMFDGLAAAFANDDSLGEKKGVATKTMRTITWQGPKGEVTSSQAIPGQKLKDIARQDGIGPIKYSCNEVRSSLLALSQAPQPRPWPRPSALAVAAAAAAAAAAANDTSGGAAGEGGASQGGVALLLAQLEAVRANVSAAADASRQAAEGEGLKEADARRKLLCKAIKAAAAKPQGEADADAKAKGGPGGRFGAGAAEGRTAAGAAETALQKKRRKHDPDALFAAEPGDVVKPEPA